MSTVSVGEIIKIDQRCFGDQAVPTVSARELHQFLEVGKVFAAWIQERITQYGFVEGQDFVVISGSGKNPAGDCFPNLESKGRGGHNRKEYAISLDMAKELAMVERNERGKQARQYFIECERRARSPEGGIHNALADPTQLRAMLLGYTEKVIELEAKVKEQAPKVAFAEQVEVAEGSITVAQAAKILGTGRTRLFAFLRQIGWVTRRNEPYQSRIESGHLDVKLGSWEHPDHGIQQSVTALVTGKGLAKLQQLWERRRMPVPTGGEEGRGARLH